MQDPLSAHPVRETLLSIWKSIRQFFSSQGGRQETQRHRARQYIKEKVDEALQKALPPEAQRRLAAHDTVIIICADTEELREWHRHFNQFFEPQDLQKHSVAFVRWENVPGKENKVAFLFLNGGVGTIHNPIVYLHELAHIVDRDVEGHRLSEHPEYKEIHQKELKTFQHLVVDAKVREHIQQPHEAFALALAWAWHNPVAVADQLPQTFQFFMEQGLVPEVKEES